MEEQRDIGTKRHRNKGRR